MQNDSMSAANIIRMPIFYYAEQAKFMNCVHDMDRRGSILAVCLYEICVWYKISLGLVQPYESIYILSWIVHCSSKKDTNWLDEKTRIDKKD
jgi:hypothetical protein